MGNWFGHRRFAGLALGAMVACAQPVLAQEVSPEPSLTGIPDIEFSLPVRPAENPGTPTEGRSLRPAAPSEPVAPTTAPVGTQTLDNLPRTPPEHASSERTQAVRSGPSDTAPAEPNSGEGPNPVEALLSDSGTVQPFDVSTATRAVDTGASGIPAWPFGLALLAVATWFALRRRRRPSRTGESPQPVEPAPRSPDSEGEMELAPEPSPSPRAFAPPPEPVAPSPAPAPRAHPALSVKIPEPVPVQSPKRPAPPAARYDAFGRPIVAETAQPKPTPKPAPKPQSRPGAKVVRYDAMGLPIRD